MDRHMAGLVADEVRKAHPQLDTRIVQQPNGTFIVKVNDGDELVMRFDGSENAN